MLARHSISAQHTYVRGSFSCVMALSAEGSTILFKHYLLSQIPRFFFVMSFTKHVNQLMVREGPSDSKLPATTDMTIMYGWEEKSKYK